MKETENYMSIYKSRVMGEVNLSGAKNSALRLLAASILTNEKVILNRSPNDLLDMKIHIAMLEKLGKTCIVNKNSIEILENGPVSTSLYWEDRSIRNTLLILGALLTRFGEAKVPIPGGCNLGERKYDLHEMLLRQMGAIVWEENGYLCAETKKKLIGCEIHLPIRSTGATENGIICGVLANGETTIWNPHIRPEIMDLISMLRNMGSNIDVYGQKCIVIHGVERLSSVTHTIIPDNMEAITWAIAAGISNGEVEIFDFPYNHLEVPMVFLRESGIKYYQSDKSVIVRGGSIYPVEISTGPYPGINSDMQPLFAVYGACSEGESKIIDLRFPGRYGYVEELSKMGVKYSIVGDVLRIDGGTRLYGTEVRALDLRAGIALWLAGLVAEGETKIKDAWQISRGYEHFEAKAKALCQIQ